MVGPWDAESGRTNDESEMIEVCYEWDWVIGKEISRNASTENKTLKSTCKKGKNTFRPPLFTCHTDASTLQPHRLSEPEHVPYLFGF